MEPGPPATASAPPAIDEQTRVAIEQACAKLVVRYAQCADSGDKPGFAAVFARDGQLIGADGKATTAEQLRTAAADPALVATFHVTTNILVDVVDERTALGCSYLTFYLLGDTADGRAIHRGPWLGRYRDIYAKTVDGWRIQRREYERLSAPSDPPGRRPRGGA